MQDSSLLRKLWLIFLASLCLAATAQAATYQVSLDPTLFGHLSQQDPLMTPTFGNNGCPVTSAVNALVYLQKKFPNFYGTNLVASYDTPTLANTAKTLGSPTYLNFYNNGVSWTDFYWGNYLYVKNNNPKPSLYLGEDNVNSGWTADRPKPTWVSEYNNPGDFPTDPASYPTWQFLYQELQKQHAVFIHWSANSGAYKHYMVLTGIYFNDVHNNGIIPKDLTGKTANITFVDPKDGHTYTAPIWTRTSGPPIDGGLIMYYTNPNPTQFPQWWTGNALVNMAMSLGYSAALNGPMSMLLDQ